MQQMLFKSMLDTVISVMYVTLEPKTVSCGFYIRIIEI